MNRVLQVVRESGQRLQEEELGLGGAEISQVNVREGQDWAQSSGKYSDYRCLLVKLSVVTLVLAGQMGDELRQQGIEAGYQADR